MLRKSLDGVTRGWLWFTVGVFPILAHAGGLAFQVSAFALALGAVLVLVVNKEQGSYLKEAWLPLYLALLAWAWVTTLWSPYEDELLLGNGLKLFVYGAVLVAIPAVFMRLSNDTRFYMRHLFLAMSVFGICVMLLDLLSGYSLAMMVEPIKEGSNLNIRQADAEMSLGRGLLTYTQMAWPIAIMLAASFRKGWVIAAAFVMILIVTAMLNRLSLVTPTFIVSALFGVLAWRLPRFGLGLAFALAISSIAFAPIVGLLASFVTEPQLSQIPISWEHRLRMWSFVGERIWESPIWGHGFDASRIYDETFPARNGLDIVIVSMHPHNIGLQIWLETGLVGVLLFCAFLAALARPILSIFATSPARASAMAALIVATAIHGALTIGAWQYWWWGVTVLSACFILFLPQKSNTQR